MLTNIVLLTEINSAGVGDYIFLILVIVVTVVQAINKQRKKERLKQMSNDDEPGSRPEPRRQREIYHPMDEQPREPFGTLFDRMEEMFDPIQYPTPEPEPEPTFYAEKSKVIQEKISEMLKKKEASKMPGDVTSPSIYDRKKKEPLKKRIRRDFSPRDAIIYSEIINRKY